MKWRVFARRSLLNPSLLIWRAQRGDVVITALSLESLWTFLSRHERGWWAL